jgi:hypothetical protein
MGICSKSAEKRVFIGHLSSSNINVIKLRKSQAVKVSKQPKRRRFEPLSGQFIRQNCLIEDIQILNLMTLVVILPKWLIEILDRCPIQ